MINKKAKLVFMTAPESSNICHLKFKGQFYKEADEYHSAPNYDAFILSERPELDLTPVYMHVVSQDDPIKILSWVYDESTNVRFRITVADKYTQEQLDAMTQSANMHKIVASTEPEIMETGIPKVTEEDVKWMFSNKLAEVDVMYEDAFPQFGVYAKLTTSSEGFFINIDKSDPDTISLEAGAQFIDTIQNHIKEEL